MFGKSQQIHPHYKVAEVDHTFTTIARPLLLQTSWNQDNNHDESFESPKALTLRSPSSPSRTIKSSSLGTVRTGDCFSYSFNGNNSITIEPKVSQRMYRILAMREDENGRKVFFDIIDGRVYGRSPGINNRLSKNVVLYESKDAALSERFPSNQVGATRSGNGLYPRILVSFDAWGEIHRRYGGGASFLCEYAKIMKIIEFLDPPHPVPKRLSDKYIEPFFFTKADRTSPNRQRADSNFKLNKFFTTGKS